MQIIDSFLLPLVAGAGTGATLAPLSGYPEVGYSVNFINPEIPFPIPPK